LTIVHEQPEGRLPGRFPTELPDRTGEALTLP
jgi:hypothetical protein